MLPNLWETAEELHFRCPPTTSYNHELGSQKSSWPGTPSHSQTSMRMHVVIDAYTYYTCTSTSILFIYLYKHRYSNLSLSLYLLSIYIFTHINIDLSLSPSRMQVVSNHGAGLSSDRDPTVVPEHIRRLQIAASRLICWRSTSRANSFMVIGDRWIHPGPGLILGASTKWYRILTAVMGKYIPVVYSYSLLYSFSMISYY